MSRSGIHHHARNTLMPRPVTSEKYVKPHELPLPPPPKTPPPVGSQPRTIAPPATQKFPVPDSQWTRGEHMEHKKFLLTMLREQIAENVELKVKLRAYEERPPVPITSRRPRPSTLAFDNLVNKVQRCRRNIEYVSGQTDELVPGVATTNGAYGKSKMPVKPSTCHPSEATGTSNSSASWSGFPEFKGFPAFVRGMKPPRNTTPPR